jgi:uncharacterized protein YbjT (DUF2867 family)
MLRKWLTAVVLPCLAMVASALVPAAASNSEGGGTSEGGERVILVTGATGTQGGAVARELLERGYRVRGLTRNPEQPRAQALARLGAEVVRGDFDDAPSLAAAMAGAHGVFAVTDFWEHGDETEVAHGRALVDAARAAGIRHFVYTSVASANKNTGIPHFDSKWVIEQYLADSGLNWSVIRPVSFMNNWHWRRREFSDGRFVDPGPPDQSHQWIAAADIAFFVGEAFDKPDAWLGRAADVAGDEMTLTEFAGLLTRVLDRPVQHVQVAWADYEAANGRELAIMHRWFATDGYAVDIAALRGRYPDLITAEAFLRSMEWRE